MMAANNVPLNFETAKCPSEPSDDEESFVVLGKSMPPESMPVEEDLTDIGISEDSIIKDALKNTAENLAYINEMQKISLKEELPNGSLHASTELTPDEIQQKVELLIEENTKLKTTLTDNNIVMKNKFDNLMKWQEEVQKVYKSHKEKFSEMKDYISKLKAENMELKSMVKVEDKTENEEVEKLKQQLDNALKEKEEISKKHIELMKISCDNMQEFELQALQKKNMDLELAVDRLNNENVDLKKQLNKEEVTSETVDSLKCEINTQTKLIEELNLKLLSERIAHENAKQILMKEINQLKSVIIKAREESSENAQEILDTMRQQLMNSQMHITELEQHKKNNLSIINEKEHEIERLQKLINDVNINQDDYLALQTQVDLYKTDFEAERSAKISMKEEKEQIEEDLRNLQRRNQQLIEEVEQLRGNDFVHVARSERTASSYSTPQHKYTCPKCNFTFRDYNTLENHVHRCIDLDMLP